MSLGIGVGIGVGFSGGGLGPARLVSRLQARLGATLLGCAYNGDATVSAGLVTGVVSRVGVNLTNGHASNKFTATSVNGRGAVTRGTTAAKSLNATVGSDVKSVWIVGSAPTDTLLNETLLWDYTGSPALKMRATTEARFYSSVEVGVTGLTHYLDGISDATIPTSGVHIYESSWAVSSVQNLGFYGRANQSWSWGGDSILAFWLSAEMSAPNRAATVLDLQRFARIT